MSSYALDIGLEIKILRERLKVSSKDLAQRIGLSQSQMSRLEKGQRRIDIRILQRIAEALEVEPSFFLRSAAEETPLAREQEDSAPSPIAPVIRYDKLGTLVRSERRKRHLTVDDLAAKVGRTKAYMLALVCPCPCPCHRLCAIPVVLTLTTLREPAGIAKVERN